MPAFFEGQEVVLPNTNIETMLRIAELSPESEVAYQLKDDPMNRGIAPICRFVLIAERESES